MSYYNASNVTDIVSLYKYTETAAPFAELMLIVVFTVTFLSLKRYEAGNAFPPACFATMITALLFYVLGMISQVWVTGTAVLFGISVLILWFR